MAQRETIITLDQDERATLKAATDGTPLEHALRRIRKNMGAELHTVQHLIEARDISRDTVTTARQALQQRLDTLQKLPALDDDTRENAEQPLRAGITQCDTLLAEQFPNHEA